MYRSLGGILAAVAVSICMASPVLGDTVTLAPTKDNTLYQIADGSLSNGSGAYLFAGATSAGLFRRAVLAFDVAGNIPAGATINSATLTLNLSKRPPAAAPQSHAVHRLIADWGEGASDAGVPGGAGTVSAPNDATWIHRFFNTSLWTSIGGDFAASPSASTTVDTLGQYSWTSAQLAGDVQSWLDLPSTNYGWIVLGDELATGEARRYDSREHATVANRPQLEIDYTPVAVPAVSTWGAVVFACLLLVAATRAIRRSRGCST